MNKSKQVAVQTGVRPLHLLLWILWVTAAGWICSAQAFDGRVVSAINGQAIAQAMVVADGEHWCRTDEDGYFTFGPDLTPTAVTVRAVGYARGRFNVTALASPPVSPAVPVVLRLSTIRPRALYLSFHGIGSELLRGDALALITQTSLNALVIDVKGDRGWVPYRSAAVAATGLGPQTPITVADMPALMKDLRGRGIYLIARIVVFKDDPLANRHPQWAVRDAHGAVWKDREDLAWIDPFQTAAWEHSLALAEEAAQLGFDEVQFDYLRFPDAVGLSFSRNNTEAGRVAAINGFLMAAQRRLQRYNVFMAADIFGYVAWNLDDTQIGQQLEALAEQVDYLSPMLYPSGFSFGIPEHRDPMSAPYELVEHSLRRAMQRTGLPGLRFRPWLQAFRDYAFDHRKFGAHEIGRQIDAADALGTDGWMLWNPRNRYSAAWLKPAPAAKRLPDAAP